MSFYQLFSDEPKDKVSVLNKQKQMTVDAQSLSFDAWNDKYGKMDEEDTKAFFPGRIYEGKETYKIFKANTPDYYDQRITSEQKRIVSREKEEALFSKDAAQKSGFLKSLIDSQNTSERINKEAPITYQYNINEDLDPVNYMTAGMISEANSRIKDKNGIGLTGDGDNEMVCIKGVCTLLANQGVDFKPAFGGYKEGVDTDEMGRLVPQFNPYFSESYDKAGFEKVPKGEKPKAGYLSQYYIGGKPKHMELVLGQSGSTIETFNNYDLYNTYKDNPKAEGEVGRSKRQLGGAYNADGYDETVYYRIKPDMATAALANNQDYQRKVKGKQTFEASDDYKQLQAANQFITDNKNTNILGDDQGLVQEIIKGFRSGAKKEDLLKALTEKSKNPKLLARTIENLYQ